MTGSGRPRWGPGTDESQELGTGKASADLYRDAERYELERTRLFRRVWHVAGHAAELPEPGDHLLWERVGQSVLIVRKADGSLAAFHNVCRHRGARIVRESGHSPSGRFTCPFHAFVYGEDGCVVHVPERETFDANQIADLRAEPVAVEAWGGWLWIHLEPSVAPPLAEFLGELDGELSWYGMEDWRYAGGSIYQAEANWKVVLEGFLEAWHTPTVHANSTRGGFDVPRSTFSSFPPHSMMVVPLTALDIDSAPEPVEHRQYADCQYLLFPNAFLNMFPDQGYLITVHPTGIDRAICQGFVVARRTAPEGVGQDAWDRSVETSIGVMDRIMGEDLEIASEISRNRESVGYRENLYNTLECRLTAFHENVERYIADDS